MTTPSHAGPEPATPAVAARGLTKRYGDLLAVDGLDLTVERGAVVALLGPNGAGKTTTVQMLATLVRPTAGRVEICGLDIATHGDEVRSLLSLTGQFAALEDHLTARENLMLMARLRGYPTGAARTVTESLVERFEIGEFGDELVKNVSGGQRRRVDLAAGLVTQPQLLVLDEPTTGLDPRSRQVVWSTVRDLVAEGVTVLLTTQYLEEADVLADEIVLIDHGRAIASGTPSALKARIGDHRVDVAAVDGPGLDLLVDALGSRFDLQIGADRRSVSIPAPHEAADLARISAAISDAGLEVEEVALRRPTLDDAFLALTGGPADDDAAAQPAAQPAADLEGARS